MAGHASAALPHHLPTTTRIDVVNGVHDDQDGEGRPAHRRSRRAHIGDRCVRVGFDERVDTAGVPTPRVGSRREPHPLPIARPGLGRVRVGCPDREMARPDWFPGARQANPHLHSRRGASSHGTPERVSRSATRLRCSIRIACQAECSPRSPIEESTDLRYHQVYWDLSSQLWRMANAHDSSN